MTTTSERLARLPLERRTSFLSRLAGPGPAGPADWPTRRQRGTTVPLSYAQNLLWFIDQLAPRQSTYNLIFSIWLRGRLDVGALEYALAEVVQRHETLRTSLRQVDGVPSQVIAPAVEVRLEVTTIEGPSGDERRAQARRLAERLVQTPFDLGQGPLWRAHLYQTGAEEHLFALTVHHVVFDAASTDIFARELAEIYGSRIEGRRSELADVTLQYGDFALWQRSWLSGARLDQLVRYWRDRLRDAPLLELPADRPRPPVFSFRGAESRMPVRGSLVDGVHRLARDMGITPYCVYVAAYVMLLNRYTGQDDLVVGCSTSVRGRLEIESMIGFFVNMLALRVDVSGDPTFRDLVRRVSGVVRDAFAHVDLPFERVVQTVAPMRDASRLPIVQATFLLPDRPRRMTMCGLEIESEQPPANTSKFDMTWQMYEDGDDSSIDVEFATDLFDPETIRQMQTHYLHLLRQGLDQPDRHLRESWILPPGERQQLIRQWNGPVRPVPDTTADRWFAEQVRRSPDAVAVVAGPEQVSYAELDSRANRLARVLRERHGAERGQRVGLSLARGIDHVVAVLAVLKTGASFVELDPTSPPERLALLAADATPCCVVTNAVAAQPFRETRAATVLIEDVSSALPADPLPATAGPQDLAYILYTSGSTGTPKGVLIEHRSLVNFIRSTQELFDLTPADRVLAYAAYTFDVSIFEMFSALLTGAQLHVALDADRLDTDRMQRLLADSRITVIDLPPSLMALLDPSPLTDLRISFVGGEAFGGDLVERWNAVSRFFNGYGPTECTVTMIVQECSGPCPGPPPIGLPMANHVAHVLDSELEPVPYGVPAELVIGGAGLAAGYLNAPELTRAKFVPDPFGTAPGGRLYRTGDLVKRRRDGAIVFIGRIDRQLKIRGVRIEPGEIETVLLRHTAVRQAHVLAAESLAGARQLVAYAGVPDQELPPDELRGLLAAALPPIMVPQEVVVLRQLPLTTSGKVNVAALPAPDRGAAAGEGPVARPRSDTEIAIATELAGPLLQLQEVSSDRTFFEMGGTSLMAAQLISALRRRFGVEIGVADFFRDSTVAGLAALVDSQCAAQVSDESLLAMVEGLSDEEAAAMLDQLP